jgi:formate/nitrite transporter FocA (FNT family)
MYLAVALYQKGQTIGILLCIPAFILSGFEHCIAFTGYLAISGFFPPLALPYLLIAILGNSIGSYFVSTISNYIKEK